MTKVIKTEDQWRSLLDEETYRVTRQKGTEYPGTGKYLLHLESGSYNCTCCGAHLFNSDQKFDSGCGWPSFDSCTVDSIDYIKDSSHGMIRIEIVCANCDAHLGHVFDDGPTETGKRYCVNSVSLSFESGR